MKLRPARRKKHCKLLKIQSLPVLTENSEIQKYTGRFNGFSVTIYNLEDINNLNCMGYFGKGNLSRSFPNFNAQKKPNIIRKRQYENRKKLNEIFLQQELTESVIILNDSDSENDDFIEASNPNLMQIFSIEETLQLCLEEAFFLSNNLKCLNVYDLNKKLLEPNILWELFANAQQNFIENYAVYHYFRTRHWVVKSGLKFGGDFLLYKSGPPFYHASYLIIINMSTEEKFQRDEMTYQRSFNSTNLIGLNRLAEAAAKEVLISQVIWPAHITKEEAIKSPNIVKLFSVNNILMRRWIAKQQKSK